MSTGSGDTVERDRGSGGTGDPDGGWRPRGDLELLDEQLRALERWHAARRTREEVVELRGMNRELRLDLQRRQMARTRQQEALLTRAAAQLAESARLLHGRAPRAVLVHRREWLRDKVAAELGRHGVDVVASLEDGADAVGIAVAEQPDLVLVEDALPTMSGAEVVRAVREFCLRATCAAHVNSPGQVATLLEAGAVRTFVRTTPPTELARDLVLLVRAG